jgi:hypothetical protein
MNAYRVGAFPDIPTIYLDNGEPTPQSHPWSGDISPASSASDFDYDQGYHSPDLSLDISKYHFSVHKEQYGQNPMTRFQLEANSPFVGSEFCVAGEFPRMVKFEYNNQLCAPPTTELFYRNGSPDGTDSAYSGGGTYSSAGSDVLQSTPRSSISQQSLWSSHSQPTAYAVQLSGSPHAGETVNMGLIQQIPDQMAQTPEPEAEYEPEEPEQYPPFGQHQFYPHVVYSAEDIQQFTSHGNGFVDSHQPSVSPVPFKEEEGEEDDEGDDPSYEPGSRRRKRTGSQAGMSPRLPRRPTMNRTQSAPNLGPRTEHHRINKSKKRTKVLAAAEGARPFPCPLAHYGCGSRFNAKNEWKRHISTQHIKTHMWRCDMCPVSADPINPNHNDFNRKDLFTQHVRRMHGDGDAEGHKFSGKGKSSSISDEALNAHVKRCTMKIRDLPPQSNCIICNKIFQGPTGWEDRIEHIAHAHFEKDKKSDCKSAVAIENWKPDLDLESWFVAEGLIERAPRGEWRLGNGQPLRQHPSDY